MDISGLECIKDAEGNWSIPGLRRELTGLEEVFLDEIERLRAERDALQAELQWLKEGRRPIQKEHFPPKDASRETER